MTERESPIHLDTSFLIRALVLGSNEAGALRDWLSEGRTLAVSTLAWGEFLCGPLSPEDDALASRIVRTHIPLGTEEATTGARLFNQTGRRRGSFADCLIAATALTSGASLATSEGTEFARFEPLGLALAL